MILRLGFLYVLLLSYPILKAENHCLQFTGDSSRLFVAHSASLEMSNFGSMSIELWLKPDSTALISQGIIRKTSSWELSLDSNLSPVFKVHGNALHQVGPSTPLCAGRWHHLAAVWDGQLIHLFIDGNHAGSDTASDMANAANRAVIIADGFSGQIDEIRIWRNALSQYAIRNAMYRELDSAAAYPQLSCYLDLNMDSVSLANDNTSMGNDALLINMDTISAWMKSTAPIPYYTSKSGDYHADSVWLTEQGQPTVNWASVRLVHPTTADSCIRIKSLHITPTGGIDLQPSACLEVEWELVNERGNEGIILRCDSTGIASLIHHNEHIRASILKYFRQDTWHHFSSPLNSAISGVFTGMWLLPYDEASGGWGNYIGQTGLLLQPAKGYAAWSSSTVTGNHTIYLLGEMNAGPMATDTLTNSAQDADYAGFNFVGNPYPSSIDWDSPAGIHTNNLNRAFYAYDPLKKNYGTYVNGIGINGAKRYIPPMQAFFVKVDAQENNALLGFNDSARVNIQEEASESINSIPAFPWLRLEMSSDSTGFLDESLITFDGVKETGFNSKKDAAKLIGTNHEVPQLWTRSTPNDTMDLAVNNLGLFLDSLNIPLDILPGHTSAYRIKLSEKHDINPNTRIVLEDNVNGLMTDLMLDSTYTFQADSSARQARFIIHFDPTGLAGSLVYHCVSQSAIPQAMVRLQYEGHDEVLISPSPNGDFIYPFADTGTYYLSGITALKPIEGTANAVDALAILRYLHGIQTLDSLQRKAADVNSDGNIDSTDAVLIAESFAFPGITFPSSDWVFDTREIHLQNTDIHNIKIRGLIRGDVTGSCYLSKRENIVLIDRK